MAITSLFSKDGQIFHLSENYSIVNFSRWFKKNSNPSFHLLNNSATTAPRSIQCRCRSPSKLYLVEGGVTSQTCQQFSATEEDVHSHSHQQVILLPDCLAWIGFLWYQISNILSVFQSSSHHSWPCIMESQKTHFLEVIKQDQQGFLYLISSLVFVLTSLQMNKQCKLFWA